MAPSGVEPERATCVFGDARVPLMKGSVGGVRAAGRDRRGRRPSPPLGMGGGLGAAVSGHGDMLFPHALNIWRRQRIVVSYVMRVGATTVCIMSRGPDRKADLIDILEVMVASADPAFLTSELADELDTTSQTIRNRLDEAEEKGLIGVKETPSAKIIWPTDDGHRYLVESR